MIRWFKNIVRETRESGLAKLGFPSARVTRLMHNELLYLSTFLDMKRSYNITAPFYPFGGAASPSLLYVLLRALKTYSFQNVLELGAGQSTVLIDSVVHGSNETSVLTLEDDPFWAGVVQSRVNHPVLLLPLRRQTLLNTEVEFYAYEDHLRGKQFDLLLVDGPRGVRHLSRGGALGLVKNHLSSQFLIIFDDVERPGEKETLRAILEYLHSEKITIFTQTIESTRSQYLIATEKFRSVCFF